MQYFCWRLNGQPLYIFCIFKYKCFAYSSFTFQELEALKQLSETSSFLTQTVQQLQTDKRYWSKEEKHTLRECFLGYLGFERNFVHKLLNNLLALFVFFSRTVGGAKEQICGFSLPSPIITSRTKQKSTTYSLDFN